MALVPVAAAANAANAYNALVAAGPTIGRGIKRAREIYDEYGPDAEFLATKIQSLARGVRTRTKYGSRLAPNAKGGTTSVKGNVSRSSQTGTSGPYGFIYPQPPPPAENNPLYAQPIGNLYYRKITFPSISPTNNQMRQRFGSSITVSGINFCEHFEAPDVGYPIHLHYACIQPKRPLTDTDIPNGFFRDTEDVSSRSLSFENVTESTDVYDFRKDCYKINPDKFFILFHKRVLLDARQYDAPTDAWPLKMSPWCHRFDKYVKLNKRVTFDHPNDTYPVNPLYFVWWAMPASPKSWPEDPTAAEPLSYMFNEQVYYRDPKTS